MLTAGALSRQWSGVKQSRSVTDPVGSKVYFKGKFLGVTDPAPPPPLRRKQPYQLGLLIGFPHRRGELGNVAVFQFLDGIDPDRLEQLGIIFAPALDAHAIGEVRPAQNGLVIT